MTPEEAREALHDLCTEIHESLGHARRYIEAGDLDKAAGMLEATGHNLEIDAMMLRRKLPAQPAA